jgi:signal transduction histidine kinase
VARLLIQNNESEEETASRMQAIYSDVDRQLSWLVAATLAAILITSLSVMRSNRRLFAEVALLSDERRDLAARLIAMRESTLREISRELHDEFGQMLTAMGAMLGRTARQLSAGSPVYTDLSEVREIPQATLAGVRELSQSLHPSALEQAGLEATVTWYLSKLQRQTDLVIEYAREGPARPVDTSVGICLSCAPAGLRAHGERGAGGGHDIQRPSQSG